MRAVLDTRFFAVSQQSRDEQVQKWARTILDSLQRNPNQGIVPSIVILEFYKLQLEDFGKVVAEIRISAILESELEIVNLDPRIAVEAAKLRCRYGELPTADAIIAATAIATSSECVLTDDKHIKQVRETKTRWI